MLVSIHYIILFENVQFIGLRYTSQDQLFKIIINITLKKNFTSFVLYYVDSFQTIDY